MPQNPVLLDRDARVSLMGEEGTFQVLELPRSRAGARGQYTVTGMEPAINEPDSGLTINRLVAAGTEYPDWVKPFYTVKPGSAGKATVAAAAKLLKSLPQGERDPYRLAKATQDFLRGDAQFRYSTERRPVDRARPSLTACCAPEPASASSTPRPWP